MEGGTFETQQMCVAQGHVPRLQSEAASGLHRCVLCPLWFWSRYIFLLFRGSLPAKGGGGVVQTQPFPCSVSWLASTVSKRLRRRSAVSGPERLLQIAAASSQKG